MHGPPLSSLLMHRTLRRCHCSYPSVMTGFRLLLKRSPGFVPTNLILQLRAYLTIQPPLAFREELYHERRVISFPLRGEPQCSPIHPDQSLFDQRFYPFPIDLKEIELLQLVKLKAHTLGKENEAFLIGMVRRRDPYRGEMLAQEL